MKLTFHPAVRQDLRGILNYYDERSDSAGDRFYAAFDEARQKLKKAPEQFHLLDDCRRRCDLANFPYHLVFEIRNDDVFVTVLRHNKRHPNFGLRRRRR
jgi:plasmid stabilization system protein ParE